MDNDLLNTLDTCKKIQIYVENNLKEEEIFQSSLDSVVSDKTIIILAPTLKNRLYKLSSRTVYKIVFFCENSLYQAQMKLKKYLTKDGIKMAQIDLISPLARIQRRESFRLETTNVSVNFSIYNEETDQIFNSEGIIDEEALKFDYLGLVKNISTGGIKFDAKEELNIGEILSLMIKLENQTLLTKGKVLFKEELNTLTSMKYNFSYKLSFQDLPEVNKKFLEKYIFDEQIKLIKKQNGND